MILFNNDQMNEDVKNFLEVITHYKQNKKNKIKLLEMKDFTSKIKICDLETKAKILLGTF